MTMQTLIVDEQASTLLITEVEGGCLLVNQLDDEELLLITEVAFNGEDGAPGPTPYEEWLSRGYEGTYEDFLRSITNGGLGDLVDAISLDPDNRLQLGSDHKLFVQDDLIPDPMVAYLLARGNI